MLRKGKRRMQSEEDFNPLSSLANLSDVMFVFSVGLMVALITASSSNVSANNNNNISSNGAPQQTIVDVQQGKELKDAPEIDSNSAGSGFTEMGTVFKDPKTGKLIMIKPVDE